MQKLCGVSGEDILFLFAWLNLRSAADCGALTGAGYKV